MQIKDELVLNGINWEEVGNIGYNIIGEFQNSDSNTTGYCIVQQTGNAYTLQEKYTCHALDPPVIIPEGKLVFPDNIMAPMRKTSSWYHKIDEAIPVMVKLKQGVVPYI